MTKTMISLEICKVPHSLKSRVVHRFLIGMGSSSEHRKTSRYGCYPGLNFSPTEFTGFTQVIRKQGERYILILEMIIVKKVDKV